APKPAQKHELHPTKQPIKDHEKQPPVKRLLTSYRVPEPEPEKEEPEPEKPPRRMQFRTIEEPVKRPVVPVPFTRDIPPAGRVEVQPQPVKKLEVQSAMKYAMKSPLQPVRQPAVPPVRKPVSEPVRHTPEPEEHAPIERPAARKPPAHDEGVEGPQFCHNCGKKLPNAANFCPGCGTKLGQHKPGSTTVPRLPHETTPPKKPPKIEDDDDEMDELPPKPPVKKAPKGSDMTILHKFLRR
ncbi:MAG: zinc ribbon domain-containing protein, partial [Methanoregula sp.]|nr:zinc ribbon domain-containing protein [Methanoregula sp.]